MSSIVAVVACTAIISANQPGIEIQQEDCVVLGFVETVLCEKIVTAFTKMSKKGKVFIPQLDPKRPVAKFKCEAPGEWEEGERS